MKKRYLVGLAVAVMMFGVVGMANATLEGDTVTATHYYPDLGGPIASTSTVVANGTSDMMYILDYYSVNVDANSIQVNFFYADYGDNIWWTPSTFNGLVVDSLNDSTMNPLQGVSIDTNLAGWDSTRLSFDGDTVYFNWQNLPFGGKYFNATLDFGQKPVPEPATMLLLGTGLAGLAGSRLRRKKA